MEKRAFQIKLSGPLWLTAFLYMGAVVLESLLGLAFPFPLEKTRKIDESRLVFSCDGKLLRVTLNSKGERLIRTRLDQVSPWLVKAIVASEDKRFFSHSGVDFRALARALVTDILQGRVVSGASTITMQVVRLLQPRRRNILSKIIEIFRARELERELTKKEILELYVNLVPAGGNLRGFEAASMRWFGKHAKDLSPEESALLVAMLPAPTRRSPDRNPRLLKYWRNVVLERMWLQGYITKEYFRKASKMKIRARKRAFPFLSPHACDFFMSRSAEKRLVIPIRWSLQKMVEEKARQFHGPEADGLAVVVIERKTLQPRAMLGSRYYLECPFNACLAKRPAGSTLKPFIYALAMEKGMIGTDSLLGDTPASFGEYEPLDFDQEWKGMVQAGFALVSSRNIPALRLLRNVGMYEWRRGLESLGISLPEAMVFLDSGLGTILVSPLELARAYAVFARRKCAFPASYRFRKMILDCLKKASPDPSIASPGEFSWKTGTSSNRKDAWCISVNENYVACVWFGNLDSSPSPGLVGATSSARLISLIMKALPVSRIEAE